MKIKVLHMLWNGSIGGAPRAVYLLIQSQVKLSKFVPAIVFAQARGHYYEEIKKLGCEVLDLGLRNDRNLFRVWRIKKIFQKYTIHHFHSPEITMMLASLLCKNAVRVYTHRGGIINYPVKKRIRHKLTGWIMRRYFHGLSGNTKHACVSAVSLFGITSRRWRLTYNGIDFSLLYPKRQKTKVARELRLPLDGAVTIGTSAQLRDWKRIDLLLCACAQLPRNSFYILIVGDGPAKQKLQDLACELGIADRTIFTGMKEDVGDYIGIMDIFVLPSQRKESFGNAAVEAMSQGIPPIVFNDGGGLLEHVQNGINGYIVSSVSELVSQLKSLVNNESLRSYLGWNAKDFVTKNYTLKRMISSYDDLYNSGLKNRLCPKVAR